MKQILESQYKMAKKLVKYCTVFLIICGAYCIWVLIGALLGKAPAGALVYPLLYTSLFGTLVLTNKSIVKRYEQQEK